MTHLHQRMLQAKRSALGRIASTIQPDANIQPASSKGWQISSPAGVAYPAVKAPLFSLASYTVPRGMNGALSGLVIVHNGAAGSFTDNEGIVVWHLFKNGYPVPGFEIITAQVGSIQDPQGTYLLLQQNDVVQVMVELPGTVAGDAPVGSPFAKLIGYLSYGGLGAYTKPSGGAQQTQQRRAGSNRYAPGSNNGSAPNSFGAGGRFNRNW